LENSWTDFCEQVNPNVLRQKQLYLFRDATRFQHSFLANAEKRVLSWTARKIPESINSDHLTALGFVGQIAAGVCYALSRWNRWWLIAVVACLAVNWLGDSLDGTVARIRHKQRPRYGFYVDHMGNPLQSGNPLAEIQYSRRNWDRAPVDCACGPENRIAHELSSRNSVCSGINCSSQLHLA
jgi:hypothetical protein